MQRMGFVMGLSTPSASERKAYGRLFDGKLTASNIEALDMRSSQTLGKGRAGDEQTQDHLLGCIIAHILVVYHLCNYETRICMLGRSIRSSCHPIDLLGH